MINIKFLRTTDEETGSELIEMIYEEKGLPANLDRVSVVVDSDPFFGRAGATQRVKEHRVRIKVASFPDSKPELWDEFNPVVYTAKIVVKYLFFHSECITERYLNLRYGFCDVSAAGTQFVINGRNAFLRMIEADRIAASEYGADEWKAYMKDVRERGLNCVSVWAGLLSENLLDAADEQGVYIKAHGMGESGSVMGSSTYRRLYLQYGVHPSLAFLPGKGIEDREECQWVEFAVRDRRDYSDAPDTKSNHLEDIKNNACPTIVTRVGERRRSITSVSENAVHLARICTRESVEEALRTPKFGGFCLHEDAMLMSLAPRRMKEFCGQVVPLLMMKKYVWSTDETFSAVLKMFNFSDQKFFERVNVSAYDEHGQCYSITTNKLRINCGGVMNLGSISIPLSQFSPGQRIELNVSLMDGKYRNIYTIWLFGDDISVNVPEHVHVSRKLDQRIERLLAAGKKVVYIPRLNSLPGDPGWFSPMASQAFDDRQKVFSGGILADVSNPALKGFPTENMADFQWWNLINSCTPVEVPANILKSAIAVMPGESESEKARAIIFEAKVGDGKLLVCTIDLLIGLDRPETRQMYAGLLAYVASGDFDPQEKMDISCLMNLSGGLTEDSHQTDEI